jgi:hypothetical protein
MPKTKPNEQCPCGSGTKYKKCCFQMEQAKQHSDSVKFDEMLLALEAKPITEPSLVRISTYFLDRYNTMSINMSNDIDSGTLTRIHSKYSKKNMFLLLARNEINDGVFNRKGASSNEDTMIIYQGHFQCFNYEKEYNEAMEAIHKWKQ